ncbi:MAG: acyl-ACP--UDP-N-acetylglucosamine O-acyltransferase [Candidatus Kappaea frigidicola]|nr:acyl-ACP--UDP-N-acetylglucosamine O-acyltransferase [Candidatus Kappaea frigidicola]
MDIHSTALVHPKAELGRGVKVGPFSIIEENVKIGDNTVIGANCYVTGYTTIGKNCSFYTGGIIGSIPQDLKYKNKVTYLQIGDNNTFREYVTINPATEEGHKTVIGDNNFLMAYCHVAHECILGNNIIIANCGTLAGFVEIEDKVVVGGLSAVHQFTRVGTFAMIGGCSKIVQDVLPYSLVDGHPAKTKGLNVVGLRRGNIPSNIRNDLKKALQVLTKSQLTTSHAVKLIQKDIKKSPEIVHLTSFIKKSKRGFCS